MFYFRYTVIKTFVEKSHGNVIWGKIHSGLENKKHTILLTSFRYESKNVSTANEWTNV
jgi:hypothetical protein